MLLGTSIKTLPRCSIPCSVGYLQIQRDYGSRLICSTFGQGEEKAWKSGATKATQWLQGVSRDEDQCFTQWEHQQPLADGFGVPLLSLVL